MKSPNSSVIPCTQSEDLLFFPELWHLTPTMAPAVIDIHQKGSSPCKQASQRREPVTKTVDSLSSPYPAVCLHSSRLNRSDNGVSCSADSTTIRNPSAKRRKKKKKQW
ncbi:hypothetical protein SDJN02_25394, partial [Cucurbita argyrosperma subsp. argyrosperma]